MSILDLIRCIYIEEIFVILGIKEVEILWGIRCFSIDVSMVNFEVGVWVKQLYKTRKKCCVFKVLTTPGTPHFLVGKMAIFPIKLSLGKSKILTFQKIKFLCFYSGVSDDVKHLSQIHSVSLT